MTSCCKNSAFICYINTQLEQPGILIRKAQRDYFQQEYLCYGLFGTKISFYHGNMGHYISSLFEKGKFKVLFSPSSLAFWGFEIGIWPCKAGRWVRFDEFVDDN